MSDEKRNPGNEKPISLYPLTPEEALAELMKAKPEHKAQQPRRFNKGDRVALSDKSQILPSDIRGKHGIVLQSWERVREQSDEPQYFLYVVQLDWADRRVEVDEADLTPP